MDNAREWLLVISPIPQHNDALLYHIILFLATTVQLWCRIAVLAGRLVGDDRAASDAL